MRKRQRTLILALIGVFVAVTVILVTTAPQRVNQPVYNGLTLAQWLDVAARHRINGYYPPAGSHSRDATPREIQAAEEAVRVIGTNALPYLLAWISYEPSHPKRFYRGLVELLPLPEHPVKNFLSVTVAGYKREHLSELAVQGFAILNTNALPVFADLSKMANDTNHPLTQILATKALPPVTNTTPQ